MKNTFIHSGPRGSGRTTAIAEACKKIDATMVCADTRQANHISREYGIQTTAVSQNAYGIRGPFIFDHFAVETLSVSYEDEIRRLQSRLNKVENLLKRARPIVAWSLDTDPDAVKVVNDIHTYFYGDSHE